MSDTTYAPLTGAKGGFALSSCFFSLSLPALSLPVRCSRSPISPPSSRLPLLASPFAPLRASVAVALRALVRPPPAPPPARPPPRVRGSATERARGGEGRYRRRQR